MDSARSSSSRCATVATYSTCRSRFMVVPYRRDALHSFSTAYSISSAPSQRPFLLLTGTVSRQRKQTRVSLLLERSADALLAAWSLKLAGGLSWCLAVQITQSSQFVCLMKKVVASVRFATGMDSSAVIVERCCCCSAAGKINQFVEAPRPRPSSLFKAGGSNKAASRLHSTAGSQRVF